MREIEDKITQAIARMNIDPKAAPVVLKDTKLNRWKIVFEGQLRRKSNLHPRAIKAVTNKFSEAVARGACPADTFVSLVSEYSNGVPEDELKEALGVINRTGV